MKRFIHSLFFTAALTLLAGGAFANNAPQNFDIIFNGPTGAVAWYFSCLGEQIEFEGVISVRLQEFETPSGVYHFVAMDKANFFAYGVQTGRVWVTPAFHRNTSQTVKKGEAFKYVSRDHYLPVEGDGPRWRFDHEWKFTINANGELVTEHGDAWLDFPNAPPDSAVRCLGKPDK